MTLAMLASAFSGATVGAVAGVAWVVVGIPMRVMDVFAVRGEKLAGAALLMGLALGTLLPFAGWSLKVGQIAAAFALLLGGTLTGMLSSALAEALDLLPAILGRAGLWTALTPICWSMAAGKAAGAFVASMFVLWGK